MAHKGEFSGIKHSDMRAFETLVRTYNESLNAFAFRILGDRESSRDVVQDVFVNLWHNRKTIDFDLPLSSYLYRATKNTALNSLRISERYSGDVDLRLPSDEDLDMFIIEEEVHRMLAKAIDTLPRRTAQVIRLSMEGLQQETIAEQMNVSVSNVKNLKKIGLERLRKLLGPLSIFLISI